ncbi:MAG: hypothetical protein ACE5KM_01800 [Planctomycetaceae bacterium]
MCRRILRTITWVPLVLCLVLLSPQLVVLHAFAFVCRALRETEADVGPFPAVAPASASPSAGGRVESKIVLCQ